MTGTRPDPTGWTVPWDEARAQSYYDAGLWAGTTILKDAEALMARSPEHVLIVDAGRAWSVGEIHDRALRLAGALRRGGLVPGDRISYQLPNWVETAIIELAAAMAGLVVNPIIAIYRDAEVCYMMADCGSKAIFVPAEFRRHDYRAMMRKVIPALPNPAQVIVVRGACEEFTSFDSLIAQAPLAGDPPVGSADDIKLVMYTSGTTGRPKAVLHSHNTIGALARMYYAHMRMTPQDVILACSPMTHITGAILGSILPWAFGIRAILMEAWSGDSAVDLIKEHDVTFLAGATPFISDLVQAAQKKDESLPSLKTFVAGGSKIPESIARSAYDQFPNCALFRAYGCTEVPASTSGEPERDCLVLNVTTDGHPVGRSEVRIVDPATEALCAPGEEGELRLRGPQAMLGYLDPGDTAAAFDSEGFFRTGDLGKEVADGWIEVSGRTKDIIIRSGENLSPKEIEDALLGHPSIADIAIVAKPSPRTGEAACAFIVPKGEATLTLADLAAFLIERGFAKQKIPEHIVLVGSLPMTAAGKVQKHLLRKEAEALP